MYADMDVLRTLWKQMAAILAVRPVIQLARSVGRLGFGVKESWEVAAACTGASLVFLSAAVLLGMMRLTPIVNSLASRLGIMPILRPLQIVLVTVLLAAQTQDFLLLLCYGSENI